jgi:hypothetical protein
MESSDQGPEEPGRRNALAVAGAEYADMARGATADLPAWFRPVAMVFVYAYGLLMTLLVAPFTLLMAPRILGYSRFCKAVSRHVRTIWLEETPAEAMAVCHRVLTELVSAYPRRVRIPPYGAASSKWALGLIGELAYAGYVGLEDWHSALGVAEEVLQAAGDDAHWEWTISKAKGLWHTGRPGEAQLLLRSLLAHEHAGPEAKRILDSWEG